MRWLDGRHYAGEFRNGLQHGFVKMSKFSFSLKLLFEILVPGNVTNGRISPFDVFYFSVQ